MSTDLRVRRARNLIAYYGDTAGIATELLTVVDELQAAINDEAARHGQTTDGGWPSCHTCWEDWPCPIAQAATKDQP